MRVLVAALLVAVLALGGLYAFGLPPFGPRGPATPPVPAAFAAVQSGDVSQVAAAVDAGADVHALDEEGMTPLMVAVATNAPTEVTEALLAAGADVNQQGANGMTALMYAAAQGTPAQVVYLLNAGADPTVRDAEGRSAADHAARNPPVRTSGAYVRLVELQDVQFVRGWPSAYVVPVEGATISSRRNHLPGAPRAYRNGVHEGFD